MLHCRTGVDGRRRPRIGSSSKRFCISGHCAGLSRFSCLGLRASQSPSQSPSQPAAEGGDSREGRVGDEADCPSCTVSHRARGPEQPTAPSLPEPPVDETVLPATTRGTTGIAFIYPPEPQVCNPYTARRRSERGGSRRGKRENSAVSQFFLPPWTFFYPPSTLNVQCRGLAPIQPSGTPVAPGPDSSLAP